MDCCGIYYSLPTVGQWLVNGLEINDEKQQYIIEINQISY